MARGYEELTTGGNNNAFPSFAPDGKRFVFRAFQKDGCGLRIMNLETKAVTTLTTEVHQTFDIDPRQ